MRVNRMNESAQVVAEFLAEQSKVKAVNYPGLKTHAGYEIAQKQMSGAGTTLSFEIPGGTTKLFEFMDALKVIDISNNLGDSKSLITHPASTTHSQLSPQEQVSAGVTPGLVRLSVGIETFKDIQADLELAFAAAK